MKREFSFAKKVSFKPLLMSIFFGLVMATISYSIFPSYPTIWLVTGVIAFLIESLVIYPIYWPQVYGLWRIDHQGIFYYDYKNWQKRVAAIFLPFLQTPTRLSFTDIKSFSIVDGKSILNTDNISGGSLKPPFHRRQYYLLLKTVGHPLIKLNLSWTTDGSVVTKEKVDQTVQLLNSKSI